LFLFVSFTRDKQRYTIILVLQFLHKKRIQDEKKENERREREKKREKKEREKVGGGGIETYYNVNKTSTYTITSRRKKPS